MVVSKAKTPLITFHLYNFYMQLNFDSSCTEKNPSGNSEIHKCYSNQNQAHSIFQNYFLTFIDPFVAPSQIIKSSQNATVHLIIILETSRL